MEKIIKILIFASGLFAGFSWLHIGELKLLNVLCSLLFIVFILSCKITMNKVPLFLFFIGMACYDAVLGSILGTLDSAGAIAIVRNLIVEIIFVYMTVYYSKTTDSEKDMIFDFMAMSISAYNTLILIIFFFFPMYKSDIVLSDTHGDRLCGYLSDNPNAYALVCLLGALIVLHRLLKKDTIFRWIITVVNIITIILIQSRAAYFALALGFVFYFYYLPHKKVILKRMLFIMLLIPFIGLSVAKDFYGRAEHVINSIGLSRFSSAGGEAGAITSVGVDDFKDERMNLIEASFETIRVHPMGIGSANQVDIIEAVTGVDLVSHNLFVGYVLTYGVVLGALWIFLIFLMFSKTFFLFWHNKISYESPFLLSSGVLLGIFCYLFFHILNWFFIWIVLAIHCSYLFTPKRITA